MPMGTDPNDTGHGPQGPSGGSDLSPQQIAAKRADLQRQLAQLPADDSDNNTAQRPQESPPAPAAPVAPLAVVQNPVESSPVAGPADATQYYYAPQAAPEQTKDEAEANDPNKNPDAPFSHWLHLADGRVLKALGVVTHWHEDDHPNTPGIPIVAAVANPAYVPGSGDLASRKRALIAELKALGLDVEALARK